MWVMRPFAFHAAAPDGHWLNDPNGLVYAGGAYRLFAQHRADAPAFAATGWARLSSDDLLDWRFDGPVIPPAGDDWAYSGSVLQSGDCLIAYHTSHTPAGEAQACRLSDDAGASWQVEPIGMPGPRVRNERDPFVFAFADEWRMLLARPCDWTDWASTPRSTLMLLRSSDRRQWEPCGTIGPWAPAGVMWEVPLLFPIGPRWALIISTVDRRRGGVSCGVRYWLGGFDGSRFTPAEDVPADGLPLDLGPDFYAAMVNTPGGWPDEAIVAVAWLSSWRTARRFPWPQGSGGPITLPRRLELRGGRLTQRVEPRVAARLVRPTAAVPPAGCGTARVAGERPFTLRATSALGSVEIVGSPATGAIGVTRRSSTDGDLNHVAHHADVLAPAGQRVLRLFVDGPVIELFIEPEGQVVSVALPVETSFDVALMLDGAEAPIAWTTL
jgi:fructan beta-fructosidase